MCLQTVRRHMCRHCRTEWTHADGLELCPEGEKVVSKHGYCAPVVDILENGGHHVSIGRVSLAPPPQLNGGGDGPHAQYHIYQQQLHAQRQQQQQQMTNGGQLYPLSNQQQVQMNGTSSNGLLEDMCEDCKEKHYREWAVEARARQAQLPA